METRLTYNCGTQEDAFLYALGSTISSFLTFVSGCSSCKALLCQSSPQDSFVHERKYTANSNLHFPSVALKTYISAVDSMIHRHIPTRIHLRGVIDKILLKVVNQLPPPTTVRCSIHSESFASVFLKKWITISLRFILRSRCDKMLREKLQRRKRRKLQMLQVPLKRTRLSE